MCGPADRGACWDVCPPARLRQGASNPPRLPVGSDGPPVHAYEGEGGNAGGRVRHAAPPAHPRDGASRGPRRTARPAPADLFPTGRPSRPPRRFRGVSLSVDARLVRDYLAEAEGLLRHLATLLIELRFTPGDPALRKSVRRGFGTLRGGAAFLGLEAVVGLSERAERLFEPQDGGQVVPEARALGLATSLLELLRNVLRQLRSGGRSGLLDASPLASHAVEDPAAGPEVAGDRPDPVVMVLVGRRRFGLPASSVSQVLEAGEACRAVNGGRACVRLPGEVLPLLELGRRAEESSEDGGPVVVLTVAGRRAALGVDRVEGRQDLAVGPLGPLAALAGLAGAGRAADGRLALVPDLAGLMDGCPA